MTFLETRLSTQFIENLYPPTTQFEDSCYTQIPTHLLPISFSDQPFYCGFENGLYGDG
jgi:hypothetical protein